MGPTAPRTARRTRTELLRNIEAEVADLAILDGVVLALQAELAALAHRGHRAGGGDQLVVADDLGADEAARDVGVDGTRGILGAGAGGHRPGAALVVADGEEGHEAEQRVAVAEHAADRGLGEPEV